MDSTRSLSVLHRVGLGLLAAALLGLQVAAFHGLRHDDAYITFRYSQNLASGAGPVFNPGERVQGSTSPGQMLLGAVVYRVAGEALMPSVMSALGCLGWIAQATALFWMLSRKGTVVDALLIALALAAGAAGSHYWVALETNLVMALTLWACALAFASRWVAVGAVCALAGLMRPDAYLLALPLGIWCLGERGWRAWPVPAVGLVSSVPWWLFATWYYGSPLPQTATATFQVVGLGRYARHLFIAPPATFFNFGAFNLGAWPVALTIGWAVAIAGGVVLIRRDVRFAALAAYALLHAAAYLYLRPFSARGWHDYPVVLVFALFALVLLVAAVHLAARALRLPTVLTVAAVGLVVLLFGLRTYAFMTTYPTNRWLGAREAVYQQIAAHLRAHAGLTDVVLSGEVGTIAYYSHRPMYDVVGLVTRGGTPSVLDDGRLGTDRVPGLRWMVGYPFNQPALPAGTPRPRLFQQGDFAALLYDLRPLASPKTGG